MKLKYFSMLLSRSAPGVVSSSIVAAVVDFLCTWQRIEKMTMKWKNFLRYAEEKTGKSSQPKFQQSTSVAL